ncbi:TnsD family Tn7-like transposition protein [Pseudomonas tohonis]|uniref:TnsD family Tn7-like transposition protein n=1 Tax=Pseudomonas tohonis TaxID=2725477 RepID=UPI001F27F758|nr:TnsD family Tn7-like transposition protein [Pseudomonas tohonis]
METTFHFFPSVYQDETLHSVLSRYAHLSALGTSRAVFNGDRSADFYSQNVVFPCRLGELIKALPASLGLSLADVITRHTVLPYYGPFLSPHQVKDAHALMAGDGKGLVLRLGLTASRLEFASRVRFCPDCIDQDIACVGAAYWHRVHQLPGVLVCPHHGTVLRVLDHRWLSRNSRKLCLPDAHDVQSHSLLPDIPVSFRSALLEISRRSQQVLDAGVQSLSPTWVRSALLEGAISLGLASRTGRLHRETLAHHISKFLSTLPAMLEYSVLGSVDTDCPPAWVEKILHKPRASHHPLKFILLACSLNVDMARLLRNSEPSLPSPPIAVPRVIAGGRCKAQRTRTFVGTSGASAEIIERALRGEDAKTIAAGLEVSLASVYRCMRAVHGGVARWEQARFARLLAERRRDFEAEYPEHLAHECSSYFWLYRHDRRWLTENVQKRVSVRPMWDRFNEHFRQLDGALAEAVSSCAATLRALPGKPVLISRTRIGRELNALSRFEKQLKKLPRCASALAAACETIEDFHLRRLRWAKEKLELEGRPITRSALYRTASIRPPDRVKPAS